MRPTAAFPSTPRETAAFPLKAARSPLNASRRGGAPCASATESFFPMALARHGMCLASPTTARSSPAAHRGSRSRTAPCAALRRLTASPPAKCSASHSPPAPPRFPAAARATARRHRASSRSDAGAPCASLSILQSSSTARTKASGAAHGKRGSVSPYIHGLSSRATAWSGVFRSRRPAGSRSRRRRLSKSAKGLAGRASTTKKTQSPDPRSISPRSASPTPPPASMAGCAPSATISNLKAVPASPSASTA